jgi:hypothetical protein
MEITSRKDPGKGRWLYLSNDRSLAIHGNPKRTPEGGLIYKVQSINPPSIAEYASVKPGIKNEPVRNNQHTKIKIARYYFSQTD